MSAKLDFTLKEEQKLKYFENSLLRRIFGPKNEWNRRRVGKNVKYTEELHKLYVAKYC